MKKLAEKLLALGILTLGLCVLTGCPGNAGENTPKDKPGTEIDTDTDTETDTDTDTETDTEIAVEPEGLDFTQTSIAASAYTYPAKAKVKSGVNPEYIDSTQTVSETITKGTPVKSPDNLVTVTPQSDGLFIHVDYNATPESMYWKHNSVRLQNVTDNSDIIEISELSIEGTEDAPTSEFLYKFTERGKVYNVWLGHQGNSKDEWGNWGETDKTPATVTAIGGYGNINFYADNLRIEIDSDGNRIINIEDFVITRPSELDGYALTLRNMRIEHGSRWVEDAEFLDIWKDFDIYTDKFTINKEDEIDVGEGQKANIVDFIAGQTQLFFYLSGKFYYDGYEYNQSFFHNYTTWVSDYFDPVEIPEHQFPLIKIVSTENGGDNGFIKQPVAHHVKDQAMAWDDPNKLLAIPDPYYEKCTIAVDDGEAFEGQVKVRGNWTTSYDKKSLRIKFDDKQNMCGLHGGEKFKNWVLLAVWKDASLLRDATALKMFKALFGNDYYSSDCKLVEVGINGEYLGVYLLAEQQQTNKKRINITEPKENSADTNIGYFIEFDSYYTSEIANERFEINYGNNIKDYEGREILAEDIQKGYTIKSDVYSAEQKDFIMKYMNRLWAICYNAVYNKEYYKFNADYKLVKYTPEGANDDEKCKNCIAEVIDIKSLANMYIFNELVCDPDLYLTSFLMDIDFGEGKDHKLRFEAPWDFDSTMGNKSFAIKDTSNEAPEKKNMSTMSESFAGNAQTDVNCEHERIHVNPWMVIFVKQAWFQQLVKDQWAAIDTATVLAGLKSFIDENSADKYQEVFNYTRYKWGDPSGNGELCEESRTAAQTSQAASAAYFKEWLTDRFAAVDTIIKGLK